jgi:protein subunit release factor A
MSLSMDRSFKSGCNMFDKFKGVEDRFREFEQLLSDPEGGSGTGTPIKNISVNTRTISPIVDAFREFQGVDRELDDSLDLLNDEDPEMKQDGR